MDNKPDVREMLAGVPKSSRELRAWTRRLLAVWKREWWSCYVRDPANDEDADTRCAQSQASYMAQYLAHLLLPGIELAGQVQGVREFMRLQLPPHRGARLRMTFQGASYPDHAEVHVRTLGGVDFADTVGIMEPDLVQAYRLDGRAWNGTWAKALVEHVVRDLRHDGFLPQLEWRIHSENPSLLELEGDCKHGGGEYPDEYYDPECARARVRSLLTDAEMLRALEALKRARRVRAPSLRRRLGLGAAEAEKLLDRLVGEGIVGTCGEVIGTLASLKASVENTPRRRGGSAWRR